MMSMEEALAIADEAWHIKRRRKPAKLEGIHQRTLEKMRAAGAVITPTLEEALRNATLKVRPA